ncbi:MAG: hypothetical protein ACYCVL_15540 [Gemmatimonadaceae bacterium]
MLVANFAAYFDTSGNEREGAILVAVGAVATVGDWIAFDERRLAQMAREGVGHFSMKDFTAFDHDFADGWKGNESRRRPFLGDLLTFTNEHVIKLVVTTLAMDDYRSVDHEREVTETFGGMYALACANCVARTMRWIVDELPDEAAHAFVEDGDIGQPAFRELIKRDFPMPDRWLSIIPKYGEGEAEITPFHVPDFIAYEYRREHEQHAAGHRHHPIRVPLTMIRGALYPEVGILTKETIESMCDDMNVAYRKRG